MSFWIKSILIEDQKKPIGIDEKTPKISWLLESDEKNVFQTACQIMIVDFENQRECLWDSGRIVTTVSNGVLYKGKELKSCTCYHVYVRVWDVQERLTEAATCFETGLMGEFIEKWPECEWIAAPRQTVCASARGVFVIESQFRIAEGSTRAGIVFGANDYRLNSSHLNEYQIAGENYIRYEINLRENPEEDSRLDIYRVGYAKDDKADCPFASLPLRTLQNLDGTSLLNSNNYHENHIMRIEVEGNNALTYIDDILVDGVIQENIRGKRLNGRTLNPRGNNDVLTYPRLNEIGFYAGPGDTAYFQYYDVRNLRAPGNTYIHETPQGSLKGGKSLFSEIVDIRSNSFQVRDNQITKNPSDTALPMFRRTFSVEKKLKKARLYITARGIYDCRINGKTVTERQLSPGLSQYDKRLNYQTYDITELLLPEINGIGVTLSSGWWSDAQTFTVKNYNYFGDREALLCKIVITYIDGTQKIIGTNQEEWKYYGNGPYIYAGLFCGEIYDARKEKIYEEYSESDYCDEFWESPIVYETTPISGYDPGFGRRWPDVNQTNPVLEGGYDAPVYITNKRYAQTRIMVEPGVYIYDFGQIMAGVPRVCLKEEAGTEVIFRYAEVLYPNSPQYGDNGGRIMTENYRDATSIDHYFCNGKESGETYQPRFTFHGYRYLEISGITNPPNIKEVESYQYSSITDFEGEFQCSNPLLTRFAENVKWSQKCNFINIPTDCPQRNERMGWLGDSHVFLKTALQNARLKLFYERNLRAITDLQESNGRFPEIAPIGGGFGGITYECAPIFMTFELYQQYGDIRTITRMYPYLRAYMNYMKDKGLPGIADSKTVGPLADWLAFQETDGQLMWNAFYYREADLMSQMADVIGHVDDAKEYRRLAGEIKQFWNKRFYDQETGETKTADGQKCDTQCSYALGLVYGLIDNKDAAGAKLAEQVKKADYTVGTGFFGTGLINQALSEQGFHEDAYKMMLQTEFPSWLYPVTQGATSIWEHWDSYTKEKGFGEYNSMNSFNHYSLGSVLSWMYTWILGIQRDNAPGAQHVNLRPVPYYLSSASGRVASTYGVIESSWTIENGCFKYQCKIPVNMNATVFLPDGTIQKIGSGNYEMHCCLKSI